MHASERVRKTLNHEEPDRVPMMFSGSRWVIERLKQHLGNIGPGVETDRQLMHFIGMDVWDTRGFDYKSGVGAKYVGLREIKGSDTFAGSLFAFYNYYEHVTEVARGFAFPTASHEEVTPYRHAELTLTFHAAD